jgi:hypothetical protein
VPCFKKGVIEICFWLEEYKNTNNYEQMFIIIGRMRENIVNIQRKVLFVAFGLGNDFARKS